jgi:diguanylate cyclase (GGDEF)-like protein/PAS domain S-box-containing protein
MVNTVGIVAAVTTALSMPAGYLFVAYSDLTKALNLKADIKAHRAAKYIYVHTQLWQYQHIRLAELIELPESDERGDSQRIVDAHGNLIVEVGSAPAAPVVTGIAPIVVRGATVGRLEVTTGARPILYETGIVTAFSCLLGFGMFFAVRIFPLRVLDRTLGALEASNEATKTANTQLLTQYARFDAALNNMSHGLLMFDVNDRIVVCNDRYIEMYGLSREIVKVGCSLRDLLQHRRDTGTLSADVDQYHAGVLTQLKQLKIVNSIVKIADGREIAMTSQLMSSGGWVATHEDVTERREADAKIVHMARHDALTDLPNRRSFREQVDQHFARLVGGESFAVLSLDLDQFKSVNDTLGHHVGDILLRQVAERLQDCLRGTDGIARLGGDEFVVLRRIATSPADAAALAAHIIDALSAPYDLDGGQAVIGASVGIAIAPADATDPDQLLKNADMALYRAKAEGRNTYRFFEPEMNARAQARRALELDLRRALPAEEFELHYQPLVLVQTEKITGFEALLRWSHPERGQIPPLEFIGLAEATGLIVPIGEWVLQNACVEAMKWPSHVRIAVNVSAAQFRRGNLAHVVVTALATSGLQPQRLELEITESVLLHESEATLATLHQLRGLGVRIAMDDFGTGYSSLSYLRSFPFDKIKIDQSFVRNLSGDENSMAIIRAVTGLGVSLGITTTAEGVETREQLDYLRREGCQEAQGYLFGRPAPAANIQKLLTDHGSTARAVA